LARSLLDLVTLRASQINDCACRIDMQGKHVRAAVESEQRLAARDVSWDTVFFIEPPAALAWPQAITRLTATHILDAR